VKSGSTSFQRISLHEKFRNETAEITSNDRMNLIIFCYGWSHRGHTSDFIEAKVHKKQEISAVADIRSTARTTQTMIYSSRINRHH
jgi:hypothetical protein